MYRWMIVDILSVISAALAVQQGHAWHVDAGCRLAPEEAMQQWQAGESRPGRLARWLLSGGAVGLECRWKMCVLL